MLSFKDVKNVSLYPKKLKNGKKVYYVKFTTPDGQIVALSTRQATKTKADNDKDDVINSYLSKLEKTTVTTDELQALKDQIEEQRAIIERLQNPENNTPTLSDYAGGFFSVGPLHGTIN